MLSRIQQDDDSVPMRKGDWWYSTQTRRGEQYPHYLRRRAVGAGSALRPERRRRDPARPQRDGARPAVPSPRPHRRHARRDAARLHDRPDRRPRLHAPRQGPRDRRRSIRGRSRRSSSAAWANDGRTLYYVTMDETKRANRLWRHVVGAAGADELLLRGERRAVRHRRRQDARRALSSSSAARARTRPSGSVADADAAPTGRSRCASCSRAAPTSSTTSSTAPAASTCASTTPGATSASSRSTPKRPTWPNAEELIAARDRVMLDDVDVFAGHLAVTERVAGSLQLRVIDLASRRRPRDRLRRAGVQRAHRAATPSSRRRRCASSTPR